MNTLDHYFGIHQDALRMRSARAQLIAENIANADTPNYKARDIDFASVLKATSEGVQSSAMRVTNAGHIGVDDASFGGFETTYRTPHGASLDNNTVDSDAEKSEFLRNAVQYQASLKFLDSKIRTLISAIKGE